ncbi:membrane protein [Fibrobacter sp. UWH1]|nr:membrane protein [Fibrobacter sp. UWH1]
MKHIFAGITCLVALVVYAMTMAPTVSFWDCGEFVACANTLGIPHPPGTPFFVFFARAVIVLLPFVEEIAKRVNYISVVSSAATVYVTALFAWELLATVLKTDALAQKISEKVRYIVLGTAALVAGFLLTFSDTFWFNAVEAEVYGIAMLILMLVSYLGLVWYNKRDDEDYANRILIFICYIAFLGVGAHLYTMLTVPAVFALLLVAEPKKIVERIPVWITGTLLCSVIYMVSAFIEISLGCLVVLAILSVAKPFRPRMNKAVRLSLAFAFFALIGYSTHLYIPIRSELNPTIDENNPEINIRDDQGNLQLGNLFKAENWDAFNAFIERKQYGSESMISRAFYRRARTAHQFLSFPHMGYGGYQMAQYLPYKVGEVNYANGVYTFDSADNQPVERFGFKFPTQMSFMGDAVLPQFLIFLIFNGLIVMVCVFIWRRNKKLGVFTSILYALCSLGLLFYINFADGTRMEQRDHDYWVSVMTRNVQDLNSRGVGINALPDPNELIDMRQNIEHTKIRIEMLKGRENTQGRIAELQKQLETYTNSSVWQNWTKIEQGFAQVGSRAPFPESVHLEVRERDYFYTPAFIFMSLIFGIGAGILVFLCATGTMPTLAAPLAAALVLVSFVIPCASNYKEHDRSGLWVPWDYAFNLLNSCRPNAILFTNGDNDTFPLWFAQEVAGVRKDVRVVNLSLGNTDWYIKQMLENEPILKLSYTKETIDSDMVLDNSSANNPNHQTSTWVKKAQRLMPQLKSRIDAMEGQQLSAADSVKLLQFKVHYQVWDAFTEWAARTRSSMMLTQHKLVVDLALQNMDRPIEISTTVGTSNFMGLEKYMVQEGMVYNLVKGDLNPKRNAFDAAYTANLIDNVYKYRGLGDGTAYINDETIRLLSSYISLYLQISFDARDKIEKLRNSHPFTADKKAQVDSLATASAKYLEMGIKQFPDEWRNYWAAAFVYQAAGMKQQAIEVANRGLEAVPSFEEGGRARLMMAIRQAETLSDEPLKVEEPAPAADSAAPADSAASAVVAAAN